MKIYALACAALAGTISFCSIASAQDWRGHHGGGGGVQQHQQPAAAPAAAPAVQGGHGAWQHPQQPQQQQPRYVQQQPRYVQQQPRYQQQPRFVQQQPRYVQQPPAYRHRAAPVYSQPHYAYSAPGYRAWGPRFQRGGYLPHEYRARRYYLNDWQAYGLYAPPYGYQWMQVGSDYLLVALASGLIANLLMQ